MSGKDKKKLSSSKEKGPKKKGVPKKGLEKAKQKAEAKDKLKQKRAKVVDKSKAALAILKPTPKLSPAKVKKARSYMQKYSSKKIDDMRDKFQKQSIYDLWSKGARFKHGYAKMTAVYGAVGADKLKQFAIKVNLYSISKLEDNIGAGHIAPENWEIARICDTSGNCRIGYRKIPGVDTGIHGTKIGYYTKGGEYLVVYTGYTITPLKISSPAKAVEQRKREQEFYKKNKERLVRMFVASGKEKDYKPYTGPYNPGEQVRRVSGINEDEAVIKRKTEWKADYFVPGDGKETRRNFMKQGKRFAEMIQEKYGVPWQITLAMSIYETGYGRSRLARQFNAFFGIKAPARIQKKYGHMGFPFKFRHYRSMYESFDDYGRLLSKYRRYRNCTKYTDNPMMALAVIVGGGYNSSVNYFDSILKIMEYGKFGHIGVKGYISESQLREDLKGFKHSESYIQNAFLRTAARRGRLRA